MAKQVKYPKVGTTYNLSKKVAEAVEELRVKEYPSVPFNALVEHLASKQLENLSDTEFDDVAKVGRNLTFTRKFKSQLDAIAEKQRATSRLYASTILNRLLEKSLSEQANND